MSFGSPTPIEVAVQGTSLADDRAFAREGTRCNWRSSTSCATCSSRSRSTTRPWTSTIDRERAGQFGLTMADVARSVVPATSSSRFIEPNYWRDPATGNAFQIQVEMPQNRMQSRRGRRQTFRSCSDGRSAAAAGRRRRAEARHHARRDRALQQAARRQPHGEHSRHHAGRSRRGEIQRAIAACRRAAARRDASTFAARSRRSSRPSPDCASACCWPWR